MKQARDFYDQFDVCREHDAPFCGAACPFRLDIIDVCQRIDKKRFNAAYKTLRDAVVFPGIVSQLCPAYCQDSCIRKTFDNPVQIKTLEQSIIALTPRKDPNSYNLPKRKDRIAVIGAGVSGMAFALKMAARKCDVTVFEKSDKIGGSLAGLMDEAEYMAEFELQFKNEEYELRLGTEVKSPEELRSFDVVYIATGRGGNDFGIEGRCGEISRAAGGPDANPVGDSAGGPDGGAVGASTGGQNAETGTAAGAADSGGPDAGEPRTGKTAVLKGGSLMGLDLMHALADGAVMAGVADNYLKTGNIDLPEPAAATRCVANEDLINVTPAVQPGDGTDQSCSAADRTHSDAGQSGSNSAQAGDDPARSDSNAKSAVYTADEAVAEAARCIRCRCDGCSAYCDLVAFYEKSPVKMRDEIFLSVKPAGSLVHKSPARKYIAACTECDIMQDSACPEHIELCNMIKVARHQMHNVDKMPAAYKQYFVRDAEHANGPEAAIVKPAPGCELPTSTEASAAGAPAGTAVSAADTTPAGRYAFFPGCSLGALNPDYVIKSYKWLLDKYPGTGLILKCCSVPLDWAGNTVPHEEALAQIKSDWESLGKPVLVTACLSCEKHFREYLPEIETVTLYELMAENGAADATADGQILPGDPGTSGKQTVPSGETATDTTTGGRVLSVFDPCSARGSEKVQAAIRKLAGACGVTTEELPKGDMHGCCGFGGQGAVAQPKFIKYVAEQRMALSDNPFLVYCANCYDVFAGQGKPVIHILDLLFDINPAAGPAVHPDRAAIQPGNGTDQPGKQAAGTSDRPDEGTDQPCAVESQPAAGTGQPCKPSASNSGRQAALPTVTQRRANRVKLKEQLLNEIWGEDMDAKPSEPAYNLKMTDEVAAKIESQRILQDDIISVISRAEETGRRTRNPENGHYKAYNEIGAITLWVEYGDFGRPENPDREIYNVYSHRMQIKLEAVFNGKKIDG